VTPVPPAIARALASQRAMLEADGYELVLGEEGPGVVIARIRAGPDACADCLVPKDLMRAYFDKALRDILDFGVPEIRLIYPGDQQN
jgi:hypothetical protein